MCEYDCKTVHLLGAGNRAGSFDFYTMRLRNLKLINDLILIFSVSPSLENKLFYIHREMIVNMKGIGNKCDFSI